MGISHVKTFMKRKISYRKRPDLQPSVSLPIKTFKIITGTAFKILYTFIVYLLRTQTMIFSEDQTE